jgi:hypothetical protein
VRRLGFVRAGIAAALLVCLSASAGAQAPQAPPAEPKRARAVRIPNGRMTIDGRLFEAEWDGAEPAKDFVQQQPREGATPTEASEVRFLFDDDNLYVGARLFDSEPGKLITNELSRDFNARDGDLFVLVMDTFRDLRNSYGFQTNPMGAQRDTQSFDEGRTTNENWDGVWRLKTSTFDRGWIVEYAIPFKSLRFPQAPTQEWGLSMMRLIRRKNEVTMWTPIPRQFNQFRMAYAGVLDGIAGVKPGLNLRFKPFVTSNVTDRGAPRATGDADGGFDLKLGIGTGLVLDATYRTDFSQVEADAQQVNLTRFNLFFPERREFFLENQGSFQVGRAAAGNNDLVPFFSRSIGLVNQLPVPIIGGVRLSGRTGRNELGLLNLQTDDDNFSVLRYGRQFRGRSTANVFYLGRERGGGDNRVAGGDLRLNLTPSFDVDVLAMRSSKEGVGDDGAYRLGATYDTSTTQVRLNYTSLGQDFRDELGFIPRPGVDIWHAGALKRYRPRRGGRVIREWRPELGYDRYEKPGFGVETETYKPTFSIDFQDGSQASVVVRQNVEAIAAPFRIRPTYAIAPGRYEFRDGETSFSTSRARRVSLNGNYRFGEFWNGSRTGGTLGVRWRQSAKLATTVTASRDVVDLPLQTFTTDLVQLRVDASFSTRMFLNAFIQYNSVTRDVSSNIRFDFIHHPLSDLFLVYNEGRPTDPLLPSSRALVLKFTQLFNF